MLKRPRKSKFGIVRVEKTKQKTSPKTSLRTFLSAFANKNSQIRVERKQKQKCATLSIPPLNKKETQFSALKNWKNLIFVKRTNLFATTTITQTDGLNIKNKNKQYFVLVRTLNKTLINNKQQQKTNTQLNVLTNRTSLTHTHTHYWLLEEKTYTEKIIDAKIK